MKEMGEREMVSSLVRTRIEKKWFKMEIESFFSWKKCNKIISNYIQQK